MTGPLFSASWVCWWSSPTSLCRCSKKLTWDKLPTNILATLVAIVLTLGAFFAYCQIKSITVVWYMVAAAVVLGFMVAYAAMFGFDKLKEVIAQLDKNKKE